MQNIHKNQHIFSLGKLVALETPLKAKATLEIFAPIELDPRISYFPWEPMSLTKTQVVYTILGHETTASSAFAWTSPNKTVATVAQNGVAKITGNLGETKIIASMIKARHNRGKALIIVLPIVGLEIISEDLVLEVLVGSNLVIPIGMWGEGNKRFSKCDLVDIKTTIADKGVAQIDVNSASDDEITEKACSYITLKGLNMGFTKLTVSHQYNTVDGKAKKVSDQITIAVLDPLLPVQPTSGKTVLSVGSTVDIVWNGGAQPWILRPENHFHQLETEDTSLIEIEEQKAVNIPKNYYVHSVTCSKLGETKLNLKVCITFFFLFH